MDNRNNSGDLMVAGNGYIGYFEWIHSHTSCNSRHCSTSKTYPGKKNSISNGTTDDKNREISTTADS